MPTSSSGSGEGRREGRPPLSAQVKRARNVAPPESGENSPAGGTSASSTAAKAGSETAGPPKPKPAASPLPEATDKEKAVHATAPDIAQSTQAPAPTLDALVRTIAERSATWPPNADSKHREEAAALLSELLRAQGVSEPFIQRLSALFQNPASLSQSAFTNCALHSMLYATLKSDLATASHLAVALFTGKPLGRLAKAPGASAFGGGQKGQQGQDGMALSDGLELIRSGMAGNAPQALGPTPTRPLVNGLKTAKAKRAALKDQTARNDVDDHLVDHLLARGLVELLGADAVAALEQQSDAANAPGVSTAQGDLLLSAESTAGFMNKALGADARIMTAGSPGGYDVARINDALANTNQGGFAFATVMNGAALWDIATNHTPGSSTPEDPQKIAQLSGLNPSSAHIVAIDGPITSHGDSFIVPIQSWGKAFPVRVDKKDMPQLFSAFTYGTSAGGKAPAQAPSSPRAGGAPDPAKLLAGVKHDRGSAAAAQGASAQPQGRYYVAYVAGAQTPRVVSQWLDNGAVRVSTGAGEEQDLEDGTFRLFEYDSQQGSPLPMAWSGDQNRWVYADPSTMGSWSQWGYGDPSAMAMDEPTVPALEKGWLVQADFMSGDRYGIAAALTLDDELGVVVLAPTGARDRAEDIARFYRDALARKAKNPKNGTPRWSPDDRVMVHEVDDVKQAYQNRDEAVGQGVLQGAQIHSATYGTEEVSRQLGYYGGKGDDGVPAWLGQQWLDPTHAGTGDNTAADDEKLSDWLATKGITPGEKYAFLWVKTGAADAEKSHHFTSPEGLRQLIDEMDDVTPVLVGDPIDVAPGNNGVALGEFWKDPSFPFKDEGRFGQLRLFRYLAKTHGDNAVNVGMRSGALEGPALMGMQTVYLEEQGNSQASRMEKWLGKLPNYHRVVLSTLPGPEQRASLAKVIRDHAWRVERETPQPRNGKLVVDGGVPYENRDDYLRYLEKEARLLETAEDGFAQEDLGQIIELLNNPSTQQASSAHNPSYADRFVAQNPAAKLAGFSPQASGSSSGSTGTAQGASAQPQGLYYVAYVAGNSTPMYVSEWLDNGAVRVGADQILASGTFRLFSYDPQQGTSLPMAWSGDQNQWVVTDPSAMAMDEPMAPALENGWLVQADFMSGDRYGIAAALTLDDQLGVVVLAPKGSRDRAEDIARFYRDAVVRKASHENNTPRWSSDERVRIHEVDDVKQTYQNRDQAIGEDLLQGAQIHSATYGTQVVSQNLKQYGGKGDHGVPAWLGQQWLDNTASEDKKLSHWLAAKGITPGEKYAFLWVKTGAADAEKSHHFTSPEGLRQLIDEMDDVTPVLVGDPIDVAPGNNGVALGEFWKDPSFPFKDEGRFGQLRLFRHLAKTHGDNAVNLGMRSGALEGPALMGMQTVYLEEQGNSQASRMEKWLGEDKLPNYHRVVLSTLPGRDQRASLAKVIRDHAWRVERETPQPRNGKLVVDGGVPYENRDDYLRYLEAEARRIETSKDGFAPDELQQIIGLLNNPSAQQASSNTNPGYADRFVAQQKAATQLAGFSGSSSGSTGDAQGASTQPQGPYFVAYVAGDSTPMYVSEWLDNGAVRVGADQILASGTFRLFSYDPQQGTSLPMAWSGDQNQWVYTDPSAMATDEPMAPALENGWLVQADFMSGDRYGIAAALTLDDQLGVVVLTPTGSRGRAEDIARFYRDALARRAKNHEESAPPWPPDERVRIHEVSNVKQTYQDRDQAIGEDLLQGAQIHSATYGTQVVSQNLKKWGGKGDSGVPAWLGQQWLDNTASEDKKLSDWLATKGITPGEKYAFLWVKTGATDAEKSHHFTSPEGLQQLIDQMGDVTPVLVGDPIDVAPGNNGVVLGEFWKDPSFPFKDEGRFGQLRLFRHLAKTHGDNAVNVGMRSGALEGPALMGMQTVYLEERGNSQASRMEKWLGEDKLPNYHRVVLSTPPGRDQRASLAKVIRDHAWRVERETPQPKHGKYVIDGAVPFEHRDDYLRYLEAEARRLERPEDGFAPDDLQQIVKLLNDPSARQASSNHNPGYADRFIAQQKAAPRLGGYSPLAHGATGASPQPTSGPDTGKGSPQENHGALQGAFSGKPEDKNAGDSPAPSSALDVAAPPPQAPSGLTTLATTASNAAKVQQGAKAQGSPVDALVRTIAERSSTWPPNADSKHREEAAALLSELLRAQGVSEPFIERLSALFQNPASLSQSAFTNCALHSMLYATLKSDLATASHLAVALFTGKPLGRLAKAPGAAAFRGGQKGQQGQDDVALSDGLDLVRRSMTGNAPQALGPTPTRPLVNGLKTAKAKRAALKDQATRNDVDDHLVDHVLARGLVELLGADAVAALEQQSDAAKAPGVSAAQGDLLLSAESTAGFMNKALGADARIMTAGSPGGYDVARINDALAKTEQGGFAFATVMNGAALWDIATNHTPGSPTPEDPQKIAQLSRLNPSSAHIVAIDGPITSHGDSFIVPIQSWGKAFPVRVDKKDMPQLFSAFTYGTSAGGKAPAQAPSKPSSGDTLGPANVLAGVKHDRGSAAAAQGASAQPQGRYYVAYVAGAQTPRVVSQWLDNGAVRVSTGAGEEQDLEDGTFRLFEYDSQQGSPLPMAWSRDQNQWIYTDPSAMGSWGQSSHDTDTSAMAMDESTAPAPEHGWIVQADFMSGDRYGIAAALTLDDKLGVVVLAPKGSRDRAEDIARFYRDALDPLPRRAKNQEGGAPPWSSDDRVRIHEVDDVKQTYQKRDQALDEDVRQGAQIHSATYGTQVVSQYLEAYTGKGDDGVPAWLGRQWLDDPHADAGDNTASEDEKLSNWLAAKGITPGKKYAFLWVKTGAADAEKSHHFTSPEGLQQLIDQMGDVTPVLVGDPIDVDPDEHSVALGEFWKDPSFPFKDEGRFGQLRLFRHLAKTHGDNAVNLGMRSGALEGPALMGMQTVYLEEQGNSQASRMEKWLGEDKLPNYHRVVLSTLPGPEQRASLAKVIRDHAERVEHEDPRFNEYGDLVVDGVVPATQRDDYLRHLEKEARRLETAGDGFAQEDLKQIIELLNNPSAQQASSNSNPSYADQFIAQNPAAKLAGFSPQASGSSSDSTGTAQGASAQPQGPYAFVHGTPTPMVVSEWMANGAVRVSTGEGAEQVLDHGTFRLFSYDAQQGAWVDPGMAWSGDQNQWVYTDPSAMATDEPMAPALENGWLVQADFMSGDRYGIAAALTLDDELGVVVLSPKASRDRAEDIARFYRDALARKASHESGTPPWSPDERVRIHEVDDVKQTYQNRDEAVGEDLLQGAQIHSATYGTQVVSQNLKKWGGKGDSGVPAWLGQQWLDNTASEDEKLSDWLATKGITPGEKYAFLWVKTGATDAEKSHHFTSPEGLQQLIAQMGNVKPVLVGDPIDVAPGNNGVVLGEFWKDPSFPFKDEGRFGQLRLFRYLAKTHGDNAVNLGMRSGALEGPALMGMQTVYLEEQGNSQASRMEKWLGKDKLPNYHRVVLSTLPGRDQRASLAKVIRDHAWRVERETPQPKNGRLVIDGAVPVENRKAYLDYLEAEARRLERPDDGFAPAELQQIIKLLNNPSAQQASSNHNSGYSERFVAQQDPATQLAGFSGSSSGSTGAAQGASAQTQTPYYVAYVAGNSTPMYVSEWLDNGAVRVGADQVLDHGTFRVFSYDPQQGTSLPMAWSGDQNQWVYTDPSAMETDEPMAPALEHGWLVQADFMSGDRYGIAAALTLDDELGVVVLAPTGSRDRAEDIARFYRDALARKAKNQEGGAPPWPPDDRVRIHEVDDVKQTYQDRDQAIGQDVLQGAQVHSATYGTQVVSQYLKQYGGKGDSGVPAWLGQQWLDNTASEDKKLRDWLATKGITPGEKYAFLWVKTGAADAEKSHHFTSPEGLQQLIDQMGDVTPVLVGDPIDVAPGNNGVALGEFWKDPSFPFKDEGRFGQLRLFRHLAKTHGDNAVNVGMRSGALEGPALMGMQTVYLEEQGNSQAARMQKWLGRDKLPNYHRVVLSTLPGPDQRASLAKVIDDHARRVERDTPQPKNGRLVIDGAVPVENRKDYLDYLEAEKQRLQRPGNGFAPAELQQIVKLLNDPSAQQASSNTNPGYADRFIAQQRAAAQLGAYSPLAHSATGASPQPTGASPAPPGRPDKGKVPPQQNHGALQGAPSGKPEDKNAGDSPAPSSGPDMAAPPPKAQSDVQQGAQAQGSPVDALVRTIAERSATWPPNADSKHREEAAALLSELLRAQGIDEPFIERLSALFQNPASLSQSAFTNCALHSMLYATLKSDLATASHLAVALFTGKPLGRLAKAPGAAAFRGGQQGQQGQDGVALSDGLELIRSGMTGNAPQALGPTPTRPLVNGLKTAKAKRAALKDQATRNDVDDHLVDHVLARGLVELLGADAVAALEQQSDAAKAPGVSTAQGDLLLSAESTAGFMNKALGADARIMTAGSPGGYDVARINDALAKTEQGGFAFATVMNGAALWDIATNHAPGSPTPDDPQKIAQLSGLDPSSAHVVAIDGPITSHGDSFIVPIQSWGKAFPVRVDKKDMPQLFGAFTYGTSAGGQSQAQAPSNPSSGDTLDPANVLAGVKRDRSGSDDDGPPSQRFHQADDQANPGTSSGSTGTAQPQGPYDAAMAMDEPTVPALNNGWLVQADFMSGDRYGIAAALTLDDELGVVVLAPTGARDRAEDIARFYRDALARKASDQNGAPPWSPGDRVMIHEVDDVKQTYKDRDQAIGEDLLQGAQIHSATYGTQMVSQYLEAFNGQGDDEVPAWLGQQWLDNPHAGTSDDTASEDEKLSNWLATKGITPGEKYAFLWVKTGATDAEKSHHFTSPEGLQQLIDQMGDVKPVLVGDPIDVAPGNNGVVLGEFWKDRSFPFRDEGRFGQLRLFRHLAKTHGDNAVNVGMRSGALEGPALMGMQTVYLEEQGNSQASRMEKWLGEDKLPNYHRVVLSTLPGPEQRASLAKVIRDHAWRVEREPERFNEYGDLVVDGVVPATQRDDYLRHLEKEARRLETAEDGFASGDLTRIIELLNNPSAQQASSNHNPSYAELFIAQQNPAAQLAGFSGSSSGSTGAAQGASTQPQGPYAFVHGTPTPMVISEWMANGAVRVNTSEGAEQVLDHGTFRLFSFDAQQGAWVDPGMAWSDEQNQWVYTDPSAMATDEPMAPALENGWLVQADFMSGDRYGIAAALTLDDQLGVVVLAPKGSRDRAEDIARFYRDALARKAKNPESGTPPWSPGDRVRILEVDDVKQTYQDRDQAVGGDVLQGAKIHSATYGTEEVSRQLGYYGGKGDNGVPAWLGQQWLDNTASEDKKLSDWLATKGITPGEKYAFLWAKTGAADAEKSHHFTSPEGLRQLIDEMDGVTPVLVGDPIDVDPGNNGVVLGEFWKDPSFPFKDEGRFGQLRLFRHLAKTHGDNAVNVGMRSGALEGPALMGMQTVYLEEQGNSQASRMEKWLGEDKLPNYHRVVLSTLPGREQRASLAKVIRDHARRVERETPQLKNGKLVVDGVVPYEHRDGYLSHLKAEATRLETSRGGFAPDDLQQIIELLNDPSPEQADHNPGYGERFLAQQDPATQLAGFSGSSSGSTGDAQGASTQPQGPYFVAYVTGDSTPMYVSEWLDNGAVRVGADQILASGTFRVFSYDPQQGTSLPMAWSGDQNQWVYTDPSAMAMDGPRVPALEHGWLVQADFMSGDRYGIAAALTLDDELGVVVLAPTGSRDHAEDIARFYHEVIVRKAKNPENGTPRWSPGDRVRIHEVDDVKQAYQDRDEAVGEDLLQGAQIHSATYGTQVVSQNLKQYGGKGDHGVPAWLAQQWLDNPHAGTGDNTASEDKKLSDWLATKGITPGKKYAFLWAKTGADDAEKSHHFTSPEGLQQLIDKRGDVTPVLVGDPIGVDPGEHGVVLGEFWKDPSFPFKDEGRFGQLRLFRYLAKTHRDNAVNVGMRSGALEGPALMGMQTVYLEEQGNSQAARMQKWLGEDKLPNYHRVVLSTLPGPDQRKSLAKVIRDHAERVKRETPQFKNGQLVVDGAVPFEHRDGYVSHLEEEATRLETAKDGFAPAELQQIIKLLNNPSAQQTSSSTNPGYADRFNAQQKAAQLGAYSPLAHGATGASPRPIGASPAPPGAPDEGKGPPPKKGGALQGAPSVKPEDKNAGDSPAPSSAPDVAAPPPQAPSDLATTPTTAAGAAEGQQGAQAQGSPVDALVRTIAERSATWPPNADSKHREEAAALLSELLRAQGVSEPFIERLSALFQNPASLSQSAFTNCALHSMLYATLKSDLATASHLAVALFTGKPLGRLAKAPGAAAFRGGQQGQQGQQGQDGVALSDGLELIRSGMTGNAPQALGPTPTRPLVNGLKTAKAKRAALKDQATRNDVDDHLVDHVLARGLVELLGADAVAALEQQSDAAKAPGVSTAQGDLLLSAESTAGFMNKALGADARIMTAGSPGGYDVARINDALAKTEQGGFAFATVMNGAALWDIAKNHAPGSPTPDDPQKIAQLSGLDPSSAHVVAIDGPITSHGDSFIVPIQSWGKAFPVRVDKKDMPQLFGAFTYGTSAGGQSQAQAPSSPRSGDTLGPANVLAGAKRDRSGSDDDGPPSQRFHGADDQANPGTSSGSTGTAQPQGPYDAAMAMDEPMVPALEHGWLVQADFMSGDRYGIAAALTLDDELGVVVLAPTGARDHAEDIARFYRDALARKASDQNGAPPWLPDDRVMIHEVDDVKQTYKDRDQAIGEDLLQGAQIHSATYGTQVVSQNLTDYGGDGDNGVPAWLAQQWLDNPHSDTGDNTASEDKKLSDWLATKGITPGEKYAFLWAKTGAADAEKSHHFTSPKGLQQLIDQMGDVKPVLVGDPIDVDPGEHGVVLGEFWKDPSFPFKDEGRFGQLRLFRYLAKTHRDNAVNVGMRSGALEGPALMGMQTVYLEEQGNSQAARMQKWLGPNKLPNYHRVVLSTLPGREQRASLAKVIRDHAERVEQQTPQLKNGQLVVDGAVPYENRDGYLSHLKEAATRLETAKDGFAPDELQQIIKLLNNPSAQQASSNSNPGYADQFIAQQNPAAQLAGFSPLAHDATGASPRPTGASPLPTGASPLPTGALPQPTGASPLPTGASPQPTGASPLPTGASPQPSGASPQPTGASPAPSGGPEAPTSPIEALVQTLVEKSGTWSSPPTQEEKREAMALATELLRELGTDAKLVVTKGKPGSDSQDGGHSTCSCVR
ncbi:hypothetical protein ACSRUE_12740 [Sorangium sp. KYC3313]|uniref:hypothetical protein n=1 Tax=Sorangium sp. KYC3313 TaxID=3449740 RepID=UPI003F8AC0DC